MQFNFLEVIKNEDKKNPYTDEEIAAMLGTTREQIVKYRKENDIPNSRERRKEQIYKDAIGILKKRENMSEREFTRELRYLGYDIGRYAAANIRKELVDWEIHQRKYKGLETMVNGDIFENIIGCNGSLKTQINQAKAAVLYPPKGLHTLLLGPSGVGKSYIAEAMYNFAKGTRNFSEKAPFMVFNCADYADNPQLLLSQLFGYCKGAFTGASEDKKGMVEISDGGILFLDEVHRLTPEGQEMLFYLLDKGKFRRLGETEISRESHIMIIAATTENPDSSLLATFKRRIPMVIRIPSLSERPYIERFNFIKTFFFEESIRLGRDILVLSVK